MGSSRRERLTVAEPRLWRRVALDQLSTVRATRRATFEHGKPGSGPTERAGNTNEVARLRAVATDDRLLVARPADDRDRNERCRRTDYVAAGDRRAGLSGKSSAPRITPSAPSEPRLSAMPSET